MTARLSSNSVGASRLDRRLEVRSPRRRDPDDGRDRRSTTFLTRQALMETWKCLSPLHLLQGCAGHAFSSLGLPAPRPPSRHESGCARTSWPPDGLLSCHDGAVRSRCKLAGTPRNDAGTRSMEGTGKIGISSDQKAAKIDRRISVAPMMDWTDRHCRYFLRGFSPDVLLYSEMITAAAIVRGDRARLLAFDPEEHPVALQLGGGEPRELPPLRHDIVRRLKGAFPTLPIVVNGGLREPRAVLEALTWCEGVMLGREAYHRPYVLAELHRTLHPGAGAVPPREALIARMERYVARQLAAGERL